MYKTSSNAYPTRKDKFIKDRTLGYIEDKLIFLGLQPRTSIFDCLCAGSSVCILCNEERPLLQCPKGIHSVCKECAQACHEKKFGMEL
jgi:hypothetical protein